MIRNCRCRSLTRAYADEANERMLDAWSDDTAVARLSRVLPVLCCELEEHADVGGTGDAGDWLWVW